MFNFESLKSDITASIVVFLVAIPLCLGIALASGAPLFAGIITGVIGGIIVGLISDSPVSVSGPAAGMISVVLAAITVLGNYQTFLLALLIAGFIQITIGLLRAGFIADYVPSNVILGLLAAIGILIIIKQLPLAFGYFNQSETVAASLKEASEIFSLAPLLHLANHLNFTASIISLISLAILLTWNKIPFEACKQIPAAIIVVIIAALINLLFKFFDPTIALGTSHLVNLPINGSFSSFLAQFMHPNFSAWKNSNVYVYAVMIAVVASLETLLNIEAAEKLDSQRRYTSRNRELIAQGVGNTISGLIGGLPITSVIVRTSVNIQAGAKTKLSAVIHGFLLILSITLFPQLLNSIPLAALATILIHTGYKLARFSLFKEMYQQGSVYFIPFIITIVAIVFTNLLLGILIGLGISFFYILRTNSKNCFVTVEETHTSGDVLRLILPQQVTFLNKAAIIDGLKKIPTQSRVIIDAKNTDYIDNDILGVINEFKNTQAKYKKISLNLEGFHDHYEVRNQTSFINATTYDVQTTLSPEKIITILKEGNKRFINNTLIHKDFKQQIEATARSQHPIAVMLGCIDSRVPVELIFDVSVGDVFVVRVAGNVGNPDVLASIEFACQVAGAKLIVVLGHTSCGAIKAACEGVNLGHITQLTEKIKPAITTERSISTDRDNDNETFLNNVSRINVHFTKSYLYDQSTIIRSLVDSNNVGLIGAVYNVSSGEVEFEDHSTIFEPMDTKQAASEIHNFAVNSTIVSQKLK